MGAPRSLLPLALLWTCKDAAPTSPAAPPPPPPTVTLPDLTADPTLPDGCPGEPPPAGGARARRLVCEAQRARGPLAMGRLGDLVLENRLARYIVRGRPESATTVGAPGGGVVDATAGDVPDGVKEVLPVLNLHGLFLEPWVVVRGDGREAIVRARFTPRPLELLQAALPLPSQRPGLRGVLEYTLAGDDPTLRMRVCAVPDGSEGTGSARPGVFALLGGAHEVLAPGTGVLDGEMASASGSLVLAEAPESAVGIDLGRPASILHAGTVTLLEATGRVAFSDTELQCVTTRLAVAPTAALALAALRAEATDPVVERAVPAGGRVEFQDADGRALLRSRGTDGRVLARLPAAPGRTRVALPGGLFGPADAPPPVGSLRVRALVTGAPGAPVRVTVRREDGAVSLRLVTTETLHHTLPAGRYRVSASRGMEHTVVSSEVTVPPGGEAVFDATLERVVATPGMVATDFHLHTELSTDSTHPVAEAVRQMAAEGLEVVASTDHDFVSDLAPVAAAEGVRDWLVAVPGVEVSTTRLGHYGGYPLRRDEALAGAGAVPWFGRSPAQLAADLRERGTDVVVQVNHPRLRGSGVFDQLGLDPATGRAQGDPVAVGLPAGTDLSPLPFDAVEVWNGYTRGGNERSFSDWLALRAAGRRFVMVGNSDSHRPDKPPGAPRSYVRVPDDAPGRTPWEAVREGLRAGDVSVGAGLYVEASTADGARPGGRGTAVDGMVSLRVRVQAPPWADCTRVRVYRGTEALIDRRVTVTDRVLRFDEVLMIPVPRPSFLVVRADGERDAEPVFDFPPFGVTNAIEVVPR